MKTKFNKTFKTIEEQLQLLKDRGLIVSDNADDYLRHINYYRLAGYWLPFEKDHSKHLFNTGATFDNVLNLYIFDRELRLILLDAIERLEVSLRTHWAYYSAEILGAHAYANSAISKNHKWHEKNLNLLRNEILRSHEEFIDHYHNKYSSPENPPIWATCEVMSLGLLSKWLTDLKPSSIRNKISKSYQVDYTVLTSFIEHLAYLCNLCAHHSRVWNRKMVKTMQIPRSKPQFIINSFNKNSDASRKIYNSLVMLLHLLNVISPGHHLKSRLINLIEKHNIDAAAMGFPIDWQQRGVWNEFR